jgi:hypothetical protein
MCLDHTAKLTKIECSDRPESTASSALAKRRGSRYKLTGGDRRAGPAGLGPVIVSAVNQDVFFR